MLAGPRQAGQLQDPDRPGLNRTGLNRPGLNRPGPVRWLSAAPGKSVGPWREARGQDGCQSTAR